MCSVAAFFLLSWSFAVRRLVHVAGYLSCGRLGSLSVSGELIVGDKWSGIRKLYLFVAENTLVILRGPKHTLIILRGPKRLCVKHAKLCTILYLLSGPLNQPVTSKFQHDIHEIHWNSKLQHISYCWISLSQWNLHLQRQALILFGESEESFERILQNWQPLMCNVSVAGMVKLILWVRTLLQHFTKQKLT